METINTYKLQIGKPRGKEEAETETYVGG